jgi:two-component system sensor histidine kinase KdpD
MVAASPEGSPLLAALDLGLRENAGKVAWVFEHASPVGGAVTAAGTPSDEVVRFYLPLLSGRQVIGALGVAGSPAIRRLARESAAKAPEDAARRVDAADTSPQVALFRAFRDQIALVLERSSLQERAIHNEALQESDRLKNALLGSVTHDLRTPLASIKAAATSLLQPGVEWTAADRDELLTFIDTSADRLNRLVSNLLDLSRLEAGGAEPVKEWYLINEVIATVLDRLEITGATRAHRITVVAQEDLPLAPFDYGQIEQVLTNLIENALKYSPGGSEIRIEAAASHDGSQLEVRVSDQGIGVPASELESIFDKFYRIQHVRLPWQTERPPLGTGLGLAICRSIIAAHGGRVWAESHEGEGATFIFTLPIPTTRPRGSLPDLARADDAPVPAPPASLAEREVSA